MIGTSRGAVLFYALSGIVLLVACTPLPATSSTPAPAWATDKDEPYPFVSPVPPLQATPVDGTYLRLSAGGPSTVEVACRRCPAYPPDVGTSQLKLHVGRYEVQHQDPPFRGAGHYRVDGDFITFFNDPECPHASGRYRWHVADDELDLELVDDDCAGSQRATDLSMRPWAAAPGAAACQPPDHEAAVTGHWPQPSACASGAHD